MVETRNGISAPRGEKSRHDSLQGRRARAALACVALSAVGWALVAEAAGPAPTFAPATTFLSGGVNPARVAVVDVSGDGKLDLITSNGGSDDLGVLLGDGHGGFGAATTFSANGDVYDLAVVDVNLDGKRDLIATNYDANTVGVLLGDGHGDFGAVTTFPTVGYSLQAVAVADVNGDGKPDLVTVSGYTSNFSVLLGDGLGGFGAPTAVLTGGYYPQSLAVADVNRDGKPDLVAANANSNDLSVLLGNGLGGFGAPALFPAGGYVPISMTVADVNGDAKLDLVTANLASTSLSVLLGDGAGGFGPATAFPTGGDRPLGVAVGDVNGDGKPDLVSAEFGLSKLAVLTGDGLGGFSAATTFSTAGVWPTAVEMADVNGDGAPDLVAPNYNSDTLAVLLNTAVFDTTAPTGTPLAVGTGGASNGQAYIPVRLQDAGSGVNQVQLTANSSNVHFEYPLGTVKTNPFSFPSPLADVTVYAVKDSNAKARVELRVTDAAGNVGLVDPIVATLELKKSGQLTRTYKQIPQAERYVQLTNGTPGFKNARLWINGKIVSKGNLTDGQTVDLDVVEWLKPGTRNIAKIVASGPKGAKAILTIGDVATGSGAALRALSGGTVNVEFSR